MDENQASPAADTFWRRFAAAAVDVMFVALPAMLLAATSAERFSIIEQTGERARFSVPDQLRINEIDQGLNRAMQLGDTVVTLSGAGLWLTLITLAVLTVLVFFVVPGLQQGQTPGRSVLRLPIRSDDTTEVELLSVSVSTAAPERRGPATAEKTAEPSSSPSPAPSPSAEAAGTPKARARRRTTVTTNDANPTSTRSAASAGQQGHSEVDMVDGPGFYLTEPGSVRTNAESAPDREAGEDKNQALREQLRTDIERGAPTIQVTLGDDDEYNQWTDLDDLDLVDREQTAGQHDRAFATLTLPESSLSETPLTASTVPDGDATNHRAATATATRAVTDTEHGTSAAAPEWSDELQSWVYRDEATNRWFRHDQTTNRWVPTGS